MSDGVALGIQAALVSLHSPTFGRLWLSNEFHPGDTVSVTCLQAMVLAAEARTGCRPQRRTALLAGRLAAVEAAVQALVDRVEASFGQQREAQDQLADAAHTLSKWQGAVRSLTSDYERQNRQQTVHCQLAWAQRKVDTYTQRLPRCQQTLQRAARRLARHERQYDEAWAAVQQLRQQQQQLLADNTANPNPIRATFRVDGGFASLANIYWLIEMGYDVYT